MRLASRSGSTALSSITMFNQAFTTRWCSCKVSLVDSPDVLLQIVTFSCFLEGLSGHDGSSAAAAASVAQPAAGDDPPQAAGPAAAAGTSAPEIYLLTQVNLLTTLVSRFTWVNPNPLKRENPSLQELD